MITDNLLFLYVEFCVDFSLLLTCDRNWLAGRIDVAALHRS